MYRTSKNKENYENVWRGLIWVSWEKNGWVIKCNYNEIRSENCFAERWQLEKWEYGGDNMKILKKYACRCHNESQNIAVKKKIGNNCGIHIFKILNLPQFVERIL